MDALNPASYDGQGAADAAAPARLLPRIERFLEGQRHRLALFIPVGIAAGILCWFTWGHAGVWHGAAIALAAIALGAFAPQGGYTRRVLILAGLLLMLGFAAISVRSWAVASDMLDSPWVGRLYARVTAVEDNVALGKQRLILDTEGRQGLPAKIRLSRAIGSGTAVMKGDVIAVKARLMPPAGPAFPGSYDFAERAWFQGLGATGSTLGAVRIVNRASGGGPGWPERLADHVRGRIDGNPGAIAATLVTGDRSGIGADAAEDMRRSGMAHLLSISGLHVTAVVGAVFLILLRTLALVPRFALRWNLPLIAASGGAVAAIFYTWLTGAEVPTIRSCIAALLILGALAMGRDPISLRLVAFGAAVVLLILPESVVGPSFQLSFAAVTAIIALHDGGPARRLRAAPATGIAARLARGTAMLFVTGLAVEATLAPIALYHFHETGLYGALANIAAIPLTTFIVMPLLAAALVADFIGIGAPFWWAAEQSLDVLLAIARTAAHAPGAHVLTSAMPPLAFMAYMTGLLLLFFLIGRGRLVGLVLAIAATGWMLTAKPADMLIDSSGRTILLQGTDGRYFTARAGGGDFMRDLIAEQTGTEAEPGNFDAWPGARCSRDACVLTARRGEDAPLRLLVTRSTRWLDYDALIAACASVDIVVSERSLPWDCKPAWLKADRRMLRDTGGLALDFDRRTVRSVADRRAHLPWAMAH